MYILISYVVELTVSQHSPECQSIPREKLPLFTAYYSEIRTPTFRRSNYANPKPIFPGIVALPNRNSENNLSRASLLTLQPTSPFFIHHHSPSHSRGPRRRTSTRLVRFIRRLGLYILDTLGLHYDAQTI